MLEIVTGEIRKYFDIVLKYFDIVSKLFLLLNISSETIGSERVVVVVDNFTCEISVLKLPEAVWPPHGPGSVIIPVLQFYQETTRPTGAPNSHQHTGGFYQFFFQSRIREVGKNSNYGQNTELPSKNIIKMILTSNRQYDL